MTSERSNRAAVLHGRGDVRIEDVPLPVPDHREVLVEVSAVGVCGSDVHYYEHGRIGSYVVESPLVLGHESSGVVVGVGPDATKHRLGERVTMEPGIPCGSCEQCRAGRYNLCPDVRFFATPPVDGAFARYVSIHEDFAFALPEAMSYEDGALIEPVSVALWACWKGAVGADTAVLVTGAGPIGRLCAQTALALGVTRVVVTDVNRARLDAAASDGAETLDVSEVRVSGNVEADVLLECSGAAAALADGIRALRPAGRAVCIGIGPTGEAVFPIDVLQRREIWVTGTFRYANTYPAAIALVASGRVRPGSLVTGRFGLEEAEAALRAGRNDPGSVKPIVLPGVARLQRRP